MVPDGGGRSTSGASWTETRDAAEHPTECESPTTGHSINRPHLVVSVFLIAI